MRMKVNKTRLASTKWSKISLREPLCTSTQNRNLCSFFKSFQKLSKNQVHKNSPDILYH